MDFLELKDNEIHVLDNSLINKIAAGEVVERPSSVVKELIENSIDAGASAITVEIRDGGINLIRVTDNGKGIYKEQVRTAFLSHATSKIQVFEDLENIFTLGFRGEALSSIASVSQVEMITKTKNSKTGTKIEISGGNIISESDAGTVDGTTFIVKNLFFNTPARRKFLKKPSTEAGYISDIVNKTALGHPYISFKYINNGSVNLHTSGNNDLKTCIFHIYGKDISKNIIELKYNKDGFNIYGFIAKPEICKSNRNYETFFINGRYVKSSLINGAVEDAFKGKLMNGKFPFFVLNLDVPKNTVDVNVHPTKLDVRFSDDDFIYNLIFDSVSDALKEHILIPEIIFDLPSKSENNQNNEKYDNNENFEDFLDDENLIIIDNESYKKDKNDNEISVNENINNNFLENYDFDDQSDILLNIDTDEIKDTIVYENIESNYKEIPNMDENKNTDILKQNKSFFDNYKIIGQIFNTYWIVQQENFIYIIDQHAAHERILYEELIKKVYEEKPVSQRLLQPLTIDLSDFQKAVIDENLELLEKFGFEIEEFGPNVYALRGVPFVFENPSNVSFFIEIIDTLADKNISSIYDTKLNIIASMACKAAVKGNSQLGFVEAKALINKIIKIENPFTCPHGRPTIIKISQKEIEKKFKRIV